MKALKRDVQATTSAQQLENVLAKGTSAAVPAAGEQAVESVVKSRGNRGTLIFEQGVTLSPNEQVAADFWLNQGRDVRALKPVGEKPVGRGRQEGIPTADFEVAGVGRVDMYNPTTSANRAIGEIFGKSSQAPIVQVELPTNSKIAAEEVARFPSRIFGHRTAEKGIQRIIVRQDGKVLLDESRK